MPADEQYAIVHEKAKQTSSHYGCYNKQRPIAGYPVLGVNGTSYPYRFSTECQYDASFTDKRCSGCKNARIFNKSPIS